MNGFYEFKVTLPDHETGKNKRSINELVNLEERKHLTQALRNEPHVSFKSMITVYIVESTLITFNIIVILNHLRSTLL